MQVLQAMKQLLGHLFRHRVSMLGVIMTTIFGLVLLAAIIRELISPSDNPYAATMIFTIVPGLFLLGLFLIPLGGILQWRRNRREVPPGEEPPRWGTRSLGGAMAFGVIATGVNLVLVGGAAFTAYSYMETPKFCGTVCHVPMQPEYEAYQQSPHSRVKCVECHVGSGVRASIDAKMRGLHQLWGVITGDFERPIKSPVHTLRAARDTCMKCHWPTKFRGDRVLFRMHYAADEANTASVNAVKLHVGGPHALTGQRGGIHWHAEDDVDIRFEVLDEKRSQVGKIEVYEKGVLQRVYLPPPGVAGEVRETRRMDCIDCHNRPTHRFARSAEFAIDEAFAKKRLDADTPFLKAVALPVLERADIPRESAVEVILQELQKRYAAEYPALELAPDALPSAARGLAEVYRRNVYPEMKVGWGTYPDHMHHAKDSTEIGCFRCHDERRVTEDGKALSQNCELCHEMLADDEAPEDLDKSLKRLLLGDQD